MHGWYFIVFQEYILEKHGGEETWEALKKQGCQIPSDGYVLRSYYEDERLLELCIAAVKILKLKMEEFLEGFGHYFCYYIIHRNNSEGMLEVQGTSLRSWLSNLNAMHDHIQMSYPGGSSKSSKFLAPVFWCEDCEEEEDSEDEDYVEDSIILHYYSPRGAIFVHVVPGIVKELANWRFDLEVEFVIKNVQGKGHQFTTYKVTAVDKDDCWKLTGADPPPKKSDLYLSDTRRNGSQQRAFSMMPTHKTHRRRSSQGKCPFTGLQRGDPHEIPRNGTSNHSRRNDNSNRSQRSNPSMPDNRGSLKSQVSNVSMMSDDDDEELERLYEFQEENEEKLKAINVTPLQMETIFPFHMILDQEFTILNVGKSLPTILARQKEEFLGKHVEDILEISRPIMERWDWKALHKLADQSFFLVPSWSMDCSVASQDASIEFKGSLFAVGSEDAVLLSLSPNVRNVDELRDLGLCMTDLPLQGCQRDTVFLGEYITQAVEAAHELDQLSRTLELEKDTSNKLLHNMLPKQVAEELRDGGTVEPKAYEFVTLFFSDVVGFTNICDQVDPWDVIDMLNQLYSVMDFLAERFQLYKVETIGDAYVAASGLPHPDAQHAERIANFAIAVIECVQLVKSPVDNKTPLQLRIGIHTGECTAGVVGTMTPHYCLFGDMVNVAARHEQCGQPGRIQTSSELYGRLHHDSACDKPQFRLSPRGLVDMKGKGERYTFWLLGATEHNEETNPTALKEIRAGVETMLKANKWKIRNYFSRKSGCLRGLESSSAGGKEEHSESEANGDPAYWPREMVPDDSDDETVNADNTERSQEDPTYFEPTTSSEHTDRSLEDFPMNGSSNPAVYPGSLFDPLVFRDAGREDLVAKVYDVMFPLLQLCMMDHASGKQSTPMDILSQELKVYIERISLSFRRHNAFHTFRRTAHVVVWSNYLFERLQDSEAGVSGKLDPGPWYRFSLTMAALIRDVKHSGVSEAQLRKEDSFVSQMHGDRNCQAKYSLSFGLDLLEDEFPDLFRELRWGCPSFLYLLRKAALVRDPRADFQACIDLPISTQQDMALRTEATMALVMKLSDLGHYTLKYDNFKEFLEATFAERRLASLAGRGPNPVATWHDDCIWDCKEHVFPLFKLCQSTFPGICRFEESLQSNLKSLLRDSDEEARKGLFPRRFTNIGIPRGSVRRSSNNGIPRASMRGSTMRDSTEQGHGIMVRRMGQSQH